MSRKNKTILTVIGATLVMALAIGTVALVTTSVASAETSTFKGANRPAFMNSAQSDGGASDFMGRDDRGFPGQGGEHDTYLAEALGITVEELQAAYEAAKDAALAEAVEQGLITKEQAESMKEGGYGFHGKGNPRGGTRGKGSGIDFEALLADALNVTVEELGAARQEASEAGVQAAIEAGDLTQEQVNQMETRKALMDYIDREALMAEALGITVEELQVTRQEGKSIRDLMDELEVSAEDFQAAMQEAHEAALQQAVKDGVITQEQADDLLSHEAGCGGRGAFPGFGGHARPGRGSHGEFGPYPDGPNTLATESDL